MVGVLSCCELQTSTWRQAFNLCGSLKPALLLCTIVRSITGQARPKGICANQERHSLTTSSALVMVALYTFVVTPSSAVTLTRTLLLPVDREIGYLVP